MLYPYLSCIDNGWQDASFLMTEFNLFAAVMAKENAHV